MTADPLACINDRLRSLEDRAEISELTARYSFAVNQGWDNTKVDLDQLPRIFSHEATWYSKAMGVRAEGIDSIVSGVRLGTAATNFAMHSYTNPIFKIDGDRAQTTWLLFIASRRHQGSPNVVFIEDEIGYIRTGDGWRIQSVERRFGMELIDGAAAHQIQGSK